MELSSWEPSSKALELKKTGRFSVLDLTGETAEARGGGTSDEADSKGKKKKGESGGEVGGNRKGGKKEETAPEREWTTELQEDYERILGVGEECIAPEELKALLLARGRGSANPGFNLYDGFEPSGRMHIAQGVFKAMNVNKCTYPGTNGTFIFWVADWFALMNDKMGGDLEKIKTVGYYLIEVWKAAGMNLDHVVFSWASDEITNKAHIYWPQMLDVARQFNITRIKKCCQIMGRLEGSLTAAQVLYPLMQCTDIFFLQAQICQLGVDQRKVNMLAREYCDAAGIKHKPVILSHHMLYGLKAGQEKMSKSDPDSAIFMEDTPQDVERKIRNAYCPTQEATEQDGQVEEDAGKESMHLTVDNLKNPCLDYVQHIILSPPGATFQVAGKEYSEFGKIRSDFLEGTITPDDLKTALISALNALLDPVRQHFTTDERAKQLLEKVKQYKKDAKTASTSGEVRRLDLVEHKKAPPNCAVVFGPLPTTNPPLQQALDLLRQISRAAAAAEAVVLYLPDWSARVRNAVDADVKVIAAYYDVLLTALRALGMPESVTVLYQSEAILTDPSNYWISVINVGRHFMLDDVMGDSMKDSDRVGVVIHRLMRVADVLGLAPSCVVHDESSEDALEAHLVDRYRDEKASLLTKPQFVALKSHSIGLHPLRESEAHKTENDEYFILDDPKVHGKSKVKKAFCEPGNIRFCPPIQLAEAFTMSSTFSDDGITIHRSAENGGDITYKTKAELESDFESGALHPGDLKAAVTEVMVSLLDRLAAAIKENGDAAKASKALKAFEKKMAKKGGKK